MSEEGRFHKILFSGNGFDLSFGLPTKYTDFINVIHNLRQLPPEQDFTQLTPAQVFGQKYSLAEHFNVAGLTFDLSLLKPSTPAQPNCIAPLNNIWFNYFIQRQKEIPDNWVDFETEIKIVLGDLVKLYELAQKHLEEKKTYLGILGGTDSKGINYSLSIDSRSRLELLNILVLYIENEIRRVVVQNPLCEIPFDDRYSQDFGGRISHYRKPHNKPIKDLKILEALYEQLQQLCDVFAYYLKQVCRTLVEHINSERVDYDLLKFDEHLTVNYTSTLDILLNKKDKATLNALHIHGELPTNDLQTLAGIGSNIVIDVDSVADSVDVLGTEVLSFTKYFQTLFKKTDAAKFIQSEKHSVISKFNNVRKPAEHRGQKIHRISPCHYYILGHSLDISDKKYIAHLFSLMFTPEGEDNLNQMTIYHHNQSALASQLRNLLDERMLGADGKARIEQLVAQGRLTFERNPQLIKTVKSAQPEKV